MAKLFEFTTRAKTMTPKQEKFCMLYIELGNASEAYRQSYNAENMSPATINVKASELLASGKIAVRVEALRAEHAERHEMTVDRISDMLIADRKLAHEIKAPSAAVAASMGLAKLHGRLRESVDLKLGYEHLTDEQIRERISAYQNNQLLLGNDNEG